MLSRYFWKSWCRHLFARNTQRGRRFTRGRQLKSTTVSAVAAEVLETRTLLSTITVTSLADNSLVDGKVTLREAIKAANTNLSVDGSVAGEATGQDIIQFAPGLTGKIQLSGSSLAITSSVRIVGNGAANTVIDAGGLFRVFSISNTSGNVDFVGVTISGGKTTSSFNHGAGILYSATGTLTLQDSVISGNATTANRSYGGAVFSSAGKIKITNCTITGNSTAGDYSNGGAVALNTGALEVSNSTITGNSTAGKHSMGGGVYSLSGSMSIWNSTFVGNSTSGYNTYGGAFIGWNGNINV
ncbi:MAG: hypothetical protein JSS02_17755, partial [Planctomycetes bacterium]|nr:hypothetical protein [Planctomycetota bacterium]